MILNHQTYQPCDPSWPAALGVGTMNPVGQGQTIMESVEGAWWIVRRDGYRKAYFANGPYRTRKEAIASHIDYLDYEKA